MISTWADLAFALLPFAAGMVGYAIGRANAIDQVRQRQAANRDLASELRAPVDLEPCEFSGFWQERI